MAKRKKAKKRAKTKRKPAKKKVAKRKTKKKAKRKPVRKTAKRKTKKKAKKKAKRKTTKRKPARKKTKKKAKKKSKRKANAAFMAPVTPSADLAAIVGSKPMPRTQITKKLWAYIKKNKLQDTKNRRNINADANLKRVFGGKKTVNMFQMTKLVSKHLS